MVHRPRSKSKATKKFKSFSDLHGSKHDMFKGVSGEQLGHDQQLSVNPIMSRDSPLINPGEAGHPMNPGRIGQAMGTNLYGDEAT